MYESDPDPYVYPGTQVLKNLLDIRNAKQLAKLERQLTAARAEEGLPNGKFDYAHYKAIHRHLFQDIFEWAGQPRTINISKGGSPFCRVDFIDTQMKALLTNLQAEKLLGGLDFPTFAARAAHYLVEINAVHPFREGNGRTQHAFLGLLMEQAGHHRDLSKVDPKALVQAAIAGFDGDEGPMVRVIASLPERRLA